MFLGNYKRLMAGAVRLALATTAALSFAAKVDASGVVFTSTNSATGNSVVVFDRADNGSLKPAGSIPTGGLGAGSGLGDSGALTFAAGGRWLLVVNAGSNDVSVFAVDGDHLTLTDRVSSGGAKPVSVTSNEEFVYVLNAGGVNNISGFRLTSHGQLRPLERATRPLSAASVGPAQVGFSPDGSMLVVTEKGTNLIDTYLVNERGIASDPIVNVSAGMTPFGFAFDVHGRLFVSEAFGGAANASAVSSYWIGRDGALHVITPSAATGQTAACWVALSRSNNHLWATNTASGSVSAYDVFYNGALNLESDGGVAALTGAGSGPTDIDISRNGRFVYIATAGSKSIQEFRVGFDGTLASIGIVDVGAAPTGLVSR